jgi:tetratricopeptide (TPR) repeat protein
MDDNVFFNLMELCRIRKFDEARTRYNEFMVTNKDADLNPNLLSWLAKIEGLSGNTNLEIEMLLEILDKFPDYYSAQFMAARAFIKINDFRQAIKFGQATLAAEASLIERPFSNSAAFLVAFASMKLRDYNTCQSYLNQFDNSHVEWFGEQLWAKKDLLAVISKNP